MNYHQAGTKTRRGKIDEENNILILIVTTLLGIMISSQIYSYEESIIPRFDEDSFSNERILVVMDNQGVNNRRRILESSSPDFNALGISQVIEVNEPTRLTLESDTINRQTNSINEIGTRNQRIENLYSILILELTTPTRSEVLRIVNYLNQRSDVISAEPDFTLSLHSSPNPNDKHFYRQWSLIEDDGINLLPAWQLTTGASFVRVGVIDSGIMYSHPDLENRVNTDLSRNFTNASRVVNHHGTKVAGVIGAEANNEIGISGIAQEVELICLMVSDGTGDRNIIASRVVEAVVHATNVGIDILNASLGDDNSNTTLESINALRVAISQFPGLFIATAGNSGMNNDINPYRFIPDLGLDNMIVVGALGRDNTRWISSRTRGSSNFGQKSVHLWAPGCYIFTTYFPLEAPHSLIYNPFSATSAAAPHVAGVAALMLSINPALTSAQLRHILINHSNPITINTPAGYQNVRALNAGLAVRAAQPFMIRSIDGIRAEITGTYKMVSGTVTIPAVINNHVVTSIRSGALQGHSQIIELNIPRSIESIDSNTFIGMTNLRRINVRFDNEHYFSSDGVLYRQTHPLQIVHIPADIREAVNIPLGVTNIPNNAFLNRHHITQLNLSPNITTIGTNAFAGMSNLRTITNLANAQTINQNTFGNINRSQVRVYIRREERTNFINRGWSGFNLVELGINGFTQLQVGDQTTLTLITNFSGITHWWVGSNNANLQVISTNQVRVTTNQAGLVRVMANTNGVTFTHTINVIPRPTCTCINNPNIIQRCCCMNNGNPNCPNIGGFRPWEANLKSEEYFEVII